MCGKRTLRNGLPRLVVFIMWEEEAGDASCWAAMASVGQRGGLREEAKAEGEEGEIEKKMRGTGTRRGKKKETEAKADRRPKAGWEVFP